MAKGLRARRRSREAAPRGARPLCFFGREADFLCRPLREDYQQPAYSISVMYQVSPPS
jgi:hypothetical protein